MTVSAGSIMTTPAITVEPHTNLADIAKLLAEKHISGVPVCSSDGMLLGMVSEDDILKPLRESVRQRRDWWLGMIAEGETISDHLLDALRPDNRTAEDIMVRHVITADENETLPRLAELIVRYRIKRVPVLRDGQVVGVVSRSDLIRALAETPGMLI